MFSVLTHKLSILAMPCLVIQNLRKLAMCSLVRLKVENACNVLSSDT